MSKLTHVTLKEEMLKKLRELKEKGPINTNNGICYNLELSMGEIYDHFSITITQIERKLFRSWDEYSGDPSYPVRGFGELSPELAYYETGNRSLWAKNTKYGMSRRRLLNHMITQLEIQLSKT